MSEIGRRVPYDRAPLNIGWRPGLALASCQFNHAEETWRSDRENEAVRAKTRPSPCTLTISEWLGQTVNPARPLGPDPWTEFSP
jgi:hypothetical protein